MTLEPIDHAALIEPVVRIANEAAAAILTIYDTEFSVVEKDDSSPVTKADLAAHKVIVTGLRELTPDIPVLSEESARLPFSERKTWDRYWLVDPLDGTREFIKRNGEFTVNIALIENHQSVMGIIQVPVTGKVYHAARGHGAWRRDSMADAPVRLSVRPLDDDNVVIAGSRSHAGERMAAFLSNVGEHEHFPMGSSLKACLVASGDADLYARLGPTSEWDTGAAQCVVEEAGGQFMTTEMEPLRYNTKDSLLNPEFFVFGAGSRDWSQHLD